MYDVRMCVEEHHHIRVQRTVWCSRDINMRSERQRMHAHTYVQKLHTYVRTYVHMYVYSLHMYVGTAKQQTCDTAATTDRSIVQDTRSPSEH